MTEKQKGKHTNGSRSRESPGVCRGPQRVVLAEADGLYKGEEADGARRSLGLFVHILESI